MKKWITVVLTFVPVIFIFLSVLLISVSYKDYKESCESIALLSEQMEELEVNSIQLVEAYKELKMENAQLKEENTQLRAENAILEALRGD